MLRGAKAMADKVDVGIVALQPTKADIEAIQPIMMGRFDEDPNIVFHVYKNRRGKWNRVKIWCYIDLGNLRIRDMFMTDNEYRLIPIEETVIETYEVNTGYDVDTQEESKKIITHNF